MNELEGHVTRIASSNTLATATERLVFPKEYAPWCYLSLDLATLARTQYARVAEYRRMRDEGIEPSRAASDSLNAVARSYRIQSRLA